MATAPRKQPPAAQQKAALPQNTGIYRWAQGPACGWASCTMETMGINRTGGVSLTLLAPLPSQCQAHSRHFINICQTELDMLTTTISNGVTLLLKTFQWISITLVIKSEFFKCGFQGPCHPGQHHLRPLQPSCCHLSDVCPLGWAILSPSLPHCPAAFVLLEVVSQGCHNHPPQGDLQQHKTIVP